MKLLSVLLLLLLLALSNSEEEDLYRVLRVGRSATSSQIKTAYRSLAKQW